MGKIITYGSSFGNGLICNAYGLSYIAALETAYGATLPTTQKEVICSTFGMITGTGTPNESDMTSLLLTDLDSRLFLYCPFDDTTANFDAYKISTNLQTGTFNNFVSGDIGVNGISGGTGKYLDFGVSPSVFGAETAFLCYVGDNVRSSGSNDMGSSESNFSIRTGINTRNNSNNRSSFVNQSTTDNISSTNSQGLYIVNRVDSSTNKVYKNGVLNQTNSTGGGTGTTNNTYGHANNLGGSVDRESPRELMTLGIFSKLTDNQAEDLAYLINYFNSNIITSGRNTY